MHASEQTTIEQLMATIEDFFGFMPPFFLPAQSAPPVLRNLLQQTLSAYIENPLPLVFKEKLFAYLSRYCSSVYCIVCHSCALRPLGMTAHEILALLEMPLPTDIEIEQQIITPELELAVLTTWPLPNTALEKSLLLASIYLFIKPEQAERCRNALLRLLGPISYNYLLEFLFYIKTCHFWVENHPELSYKSDQRAQEHLAALLTDEPALADLFRNHRVTSRHESLAALLTMAEVLVQNTGEDKQGETLTSTQSQATGIGQQLMKLTCSILGCERVSVIGIDSQTESIHPIAIFGLSPELEQLWWSSLEQAHLSDLLVDPDLIKRLYTHEEIYLDLTQPALNSIPNPFHILTVLMVPMWIDNRLVGLLSLDHGKRWHEYTQEEIVLARAVAKLVTLVIERERLIQERTAAQANELALREANRRMDEFMGIASHELKTPLTTIKGYVQLVARRLRNSSKSLKNSDGQKQVLESTGELLERTDIQIGRLGRLVNELLDVSRIQANKLELHLEPCNLAFLVQEAVQDQQQEFPERTITLELPIADSLSVIVDADRIGQVLSNYLSNALKYSPTDRPVKVRLQAEGEFATVFVHDEGPGLSSIDQQHIWERFYRVQGIEVQSGSGVGLGLGLYICRTIIERHSGKVGVESIPGAGSTFWFSLPRAKNNQQ